jgi:hypothetical protein
MAGGAARPSPYKSLPPTPLLQLGRAGRPCRSIIYGLQPLWSVLPALTDRTCLPRPEMLGYELLTIPAAAIYSTMNGYNRLKSSMENQVIALVVPCLLPALYRKSNLCIPKKGIARPPVPILHSCVCERFIYSQDRSTYVWLQQNRQTDPGNI